MKPPDSRIYVGRLEADRPTVYVVSATSVERLRPAGAAFEWGAGLSRELARALLTDASGSDPPADVCRRFAEQILSRLPADGFAIQSDTVTAWLRRFARV